MFLFSRTLICITGLLKIDLRLLRATEKERFKFRMAAIKNLNPKAELARNHQALAINISAARGLRDVMKTNLGPKGTMKMLVSGAGDIKLTKDGNVLLNEMQIQSPPAMLIAKCATALDDTVGKSSSYLAKKDSILIRRRNFSAHLLYW
jgi:hypothetical protein